MSPTITDGVIVIVDPDAAPAHGQIVIARTNSHGEATCKPLSLDGCTAYPTPDNDRYPVLPVTNDTDIVCVVREARLLL